MEPSREKRYWFYAKRHGYGWGLPATWEGWVVLIACIAGAVGGLAILPPEPSPLPYVIFLSAISVLLTLICYAKGEPTRWRWGGSERAEHPCSAAPGRSTGKGGVLLLHMLLGPAIVGLAVFLRAYPPAEINHTYGYRTSASMRSQEAWDEAQRYSANIMLVSGVVLILFQMLTVLIMRPPLSVAASAAALVVVVLCVVPITEAHLKKTFDNQGQRIEVRAP